MRVKTNRELVLCSGTTEYLYAKSLQMELPRSLRGSITVEIPNSTMNDPWELANEAIRKKKQSNRDKNPYSNIWLLYGNPNANLSAISNYLGSNGLRAAYCPMCLEQWFILHFEEFAATFETREKAIEHLKKIWPEYRKNKIDAYAALKEFLPKAMNRAIATNLNQNANEAENVPIFTIPEMIIFFESIKLAS